MYTLSLTGIWVSTRGDRQLYLLTDLIIVVADRHSGPGERLQYSKLQIDILGYSVAYRSLYTFSWTDILVYTFDDRPQYPGLLADTLIYSVAYRSWLTLSLTNILVYSPCDIPLYPGLQTDTLGSSVADRSLYTLLLIQVYL